MADSSSEIEDTRRRRIRQRIFMSVTTLVGLGTAFGSWLLRDVDAWWSSTLANGAVAIFLLVPGEFFLTRMRTGFASIEKATDDVRATAESAKESAESAMESAEKTARSLEDVRRTLMDRQRDEHERELDVYRDIVTNLSRESLVRALRKATAEEVLSEQGVRVPIWETPLHYRYVLGDNDRLTVRLEQDDGDIISTHSWEPGVAAENFCQALVTAVRKAGQDLGVGLNDPTHALQELSEMLVTVTGHRAQELMGHREKLKRIIELRDGWYFTEKSLIRAADLQYVIGAKRLDEMDWETHLLGKGWYEAPDAIQFARRLYGAR